MEKTVLFWLYENWLSWSIKPALKRIIQMCYHASWCWYRFFLPAMVLLVPFINCSLILIELTTSLQVTINKFPDTIWWSSFFHAKYLPRPLNDENSTKVDLRCQASVPNFHTFIWHLVPVKFWRSSKL